MVANKEADELYSLLSKFIEEGRPAWEAFRDACVSNGEGQITIDLGEAAQWFEDIADGNL